MGSIRFLALAAVFAASAAGAQPIPLAGLAPSAGPNGQAGARPAGPNAQVALRPAGPNGAIAANARSTEVHYPNCAAAGAARALPVQRGEPGYGRHLDRTGTGIACESHPGAGRGTIPGKGIAEQHAR